MATERQDFARRLRQRSTKPEDILWAVLRGRRLSRAKFRRQMPILAYTVDFFCFEHKLIVEIDGRQHDWERHYDEASSGEIERHGFVVVRFKNAKILDELDAVVATIKRALAMMTD